MRYVMQSYLIPILSYPTLPYAGRCRDFLLLRCWQSKHAEKLLELNEDIVQRDRDLKMELQLARSMQEEMATKLAAYQRTIRQLNERIAAAEAEAQRGRQERDEEVRQQVRPPFPPSLPPSSLVSRRGA